MAMKTFIMDTEMLYIVSLYTEPQKKRYKVVYCITL